MFGPPGLGGLAQQAASLFWTHVAPARRPETNSCSLDRLWRQSATRDIEQLDGEIEEGFRGKARLPHHAPESSRSSGTEEA